MRLAILGKDDVIEQLLVCLAAGGHLLIEDLPGVGKTTLAYALARSTDCVFSRIQFTSDLLPSDVTGVAIYDESTKEFVFKPGPVFANIVLADEINRAPPKTQSALLEVMDRARVTVDGESHSVGSPFMVFATQNPVDYEGTFPLPESQMDRFLMRLRMGYPQHARRDRDPAQLARRLRLDRAEPRRHPRRRRGPPGPRAPGLRRGQHPRLHPAHRGGDAHRDRVQARAPACAAASPCARRPRPAPS